MTDFSFLPNAAATQYLWRNVKNEIFQSKEVYLIFDDTVINKKSTQKIELVRRQYSSNKHQVIQGIIIVNCIYFYPQSQGHFILDFGNEFIDFQTGKDKFPKA